MIRFILTAGFILGALAVAAGAAGAHGIKAHYPPGVVATYETAVRYMMFHALGLLAIGLSLFHTTERKLLSIAGIIMLAGICAFTAGLLGSAFLSTAWGHMAMVGGMTLIVSWILAAVGAATLKLGR
jgi:uncharacterized membrane protein YgdD (TMEM256/DUF423 family)